MSNEKRDKILFPISKRVLWKSLTTISKVTASKVYYVSKN